MKNLKMTEIDEILSDRELEEIVNTIVKKTIGRSLTDIETQILKGIYQGKTYPTLEKEISHSEQHIKNTASSLFKILNASKLLEEKVNKNNFISIFQRYKINSQNNYKRAKNNKLILVNGEITKLNEATLIALVRSFQEKGQDVTIEIINIEEGSIKITIQGTEEGLALIQELFDSGNLETIEDFKVLEVRDLDKEEQKKLKAKFIRKANLRGAYLKGANLSGAKLRGANLSLANLIEADLRGANLSRADLIETNLSRANLIEANLIEANLIEANLIEANLSGAKLSSANLGLAYLSSANLKKANLKKANLKRANLIEANLSEAYLSEANLSEAYLIETDLIEADLRGANLSRANLIEADLSKANLIEADLRGANLKRTNLRETKLREANLRETKLREANLSEAYLSKADLIEADLSRANLNKADLREANLSGANLMGAYVKNARFTNTKGINPEQKHNLIVRGAIFDDSHHDFSKVLT